MKGLISRGNASSPPVLRVELGCDFTQVRPVADQVKDFLQKHGCHNEARADCELVVVEGCNNAIKHSQLESVQEPIIVEVILASTEIELRITDHGPGFTWPETAQLPEPEQESGRGLYLIRALTDYAAYFRRAKENILVLRKKRAAV